MLKKNKTNSFLLITAFQLNRIFQQGLPFVLFHEEKPTPTHPAANFVPTTTS